MKDYLQALRRLATAAGTRPRAVASALNGLADHSLAVDYARTVASTVPISAVQGPTDNGLWAYFQGHVEGPGIWKWEHYFEVYHRHLAKFVGRPVNLLEIGIFSGGSLGMWRTYLGDRSHIYGVDIEEACRAYETEHVSVFIGDQADRAFWSGFKREVPAVDVVIDDGGHTPEQQRATLEELLPHLRPGGVYICEDIHGAGNRFGSYMASLTTELNQVQGIQGSSTDSETTGFQRTVHSIHFYPYVVVLEKHLASPERLTAPRRGTQWQPFL